MSTSAVIRQEVSFAGEVNPDQESCSDMIRRRSAQWFSKAISVYPVAKQAAIDIEVDPAYLTHMCAGKKPVNLTHAERMRMGNQRAYEALVEAMALDAPRLLVIPRLDIVLKPESARMLRHLRVLAGIAWPSYRDQIAAQEYSCSGDQLEMAMMANEGLGT